MPLVDQFTGISIKVMYERYFPVLKQVQHVRRNTNNPNHLMLDIL